MNELIRKICILMITAMLTVSQAVTAVPVYANGTSAAGGSEVDVTENEEKTPAGQETDPEGGGSGKENNEETNSVSGAGTVEEESNSSSMLIWPFSYMYLILIFIVSYWEASCPLAIASSD
jgi:hypothetical protein